LNSVQSHKKFLNCGVPQGSVLDQLLFTLYINDIANSTTCSPRLYADDTCLILQHDNLSQLKLKISEEINTVSKWTANKLTLNINKSNLIMINSKTNNHFNNLPSSNADIILPKISTVKSAKYLGVTFDNSLSFDRHTKIWKNDNHDQ